MKHLFLLLFIVFSASHISAQISLIAHKNVNLQISNPQQVTDIYTLETTSAGNMKIILFDLKSGSVKDNFLSKIGKKANELKMIWMKATLAGDGKAPELLDDEASVLQKVASTPGAIGYVSSSSVTPDVKVLFELK